MFSKRGKNSSARPIFASLSGKAKIRDFLGRWYNFPEGAKPREDKLKIACTCLKQIRRSAMGEGRESFFAVFATSCPEYVGGLRADDGVSPMERATRNALLIVFIRIYSLQLIPPASTRTNRNVLIHDRSNNIVYSARLVRRALVRRPTRPSRSSTSLFNSSTTHSKPRRSFLCVVCRAHVIINYPSNHINGSACARNSKHARDSRSWKIHPPFENASKMKFVPSKRPSLSSQFDLRLSHRFD